jgi:hypothetical protein
VHVQSGSTFDVRQRAETAEAEVERLKRMYDEAKEAATRLGSQLSSQMDQLKQA